MSRTDTLLRVTIALYCGARLGQLWADRLPIEQMSPVKRGSRIFRYATCLTPIKADILGPPLRWAKDGPYRLCAIRPASSVESLRVAEWKCATNGRSPLPK